jgi:hypothetical protein
VLNCKFENKVVNGNILVCNEVITFDFELIQIEAIDHIFNEIVWKLYILETDFSFTNHKRLMIITDELEN